LPRNTLFSRLPHIWHTLDRQHLIDDKGILERYLGVLDNDFNRSYSKIKELLKVRTIDQLPDRFLFLLSHFVGHDWRQDKSSAWNRRRIHNAITTHSYKGTLARVKDTILRHGSTFGSVQDNASMLVVLSRQGYLSKDNAHITDANYWHDGVFVLRTTGNLDNEFLDDFLPIRPAGEVWFLESIFDKFILFDLDVTISRYQVSYYDNVRSQMLSYGYLESGLRPEPVIWLSYDAQLPVACARYGFLDIIQGNTIKVDSNLPCNSTSVLVTSTHITSDLDSALQAPHFFKTKES
jgi:hypothetical protein